MLSRVAESVYWMSRYIERAENVARFVDVNIQLMLDAPEGQDQQWAPLVAITGDQAEFAKRYGAATETSVIQFLTFDADNPNSILACLRAARENARSVREIISSAMWLQLNRLYQPSLQWHDRRHHDARRGVALQPAGADARTGRQDLAYSRREVLSPAPFRRGGGDTV